MIHIGIYWYINTWYAGGVYWGFGEKEKEREVEGAISKQRRKEERRKREEVVKEEGRRRKMMRRKRIVVVYLGSYNISSTGEAIISSKWQK